MSEQTSLPGFDVEPVTTPDETHALAKAIFEENLAADDGWGDIYLSLLEEGWEWRKAAYIAWASLPALQRHPPTLKEFASLIGLRGTSAILNWRNKNKAIDLTVAKLSQQLVMEAAPDIVQALLDSASNPNYKHAPDRRVALEMAGLYTPRSKIALGQDGASDTDETELSTEELRRLAAMGEAGKGDADA